MVTGRSEAILVVAAIFLWLSLSAGSLRCFVRFRLTHAAGCDDYLMVAAMFFNIGFGVCTILGATFGMGKKLVYFEESKGSFRNAMLLFWLGQLFYVFTSVIVRLSITLTLLRLTVDNLHRSILFAATVLSIVAGTIFFFFTIFQCTPVAYYWNRMTEEGHCMDFDVLLGIVYMYSAAAAVCDFTIGLLPIFMIGRLKMDRHTKMAVIGILSIGCLASTAVIVRIPFVHLSKSPEFLCSLYHVQPRLDDILNDVAPFPYTLGAFIAFLSEHQCLETVEFLLETERYRRIYHWLEHKTEACEAVRKAHLSGLWTRLINQYIRPHSEREINIPSDIRQQLLQQFHNRGDDPPPPEVLDRVVNNIKELLRGSILIPFLRRSSTTARVQPLSMPSLNDSLPEAAVSSPSIADDIKVNRYPREDYPSYRGDGDAARRYGAYGDPASSSAEDDPAYTSSAMMSSASDRSDIQDFAFKGSGGTTNSRTRAVPDRPSRGDRKAHGWRKRFKEGLVKHLPRSSD
ncbi:hypothetical protein CNMCM7691_008965 [Aspergillus felis]|uniref:RGS domain-containing protein n=1 Tax=Aspergillus felis TaxID=1287682 RepID=A0A8H6QW32_9EURO|nr:hypothetical protein CNMCM7691_008965 [Aspergillus felis]